MPITKTPYDAGMAEYMQQESATPYTYKDPTGESDPIESLTKIGVKWNERRSKEVKLEKDYHPKVYRRLVLRALSLGGLAPHGLSAFVRCTPS